MSHLESANIILPNGLNRIESLKTLATLFVMGKHDYHYEGGFLPRTMINVFPQPRKTFENIHEMAQDEYQKGQLNLLTIAPFDKNGCEEYLHLINFLWKTNFSVNDARVLIQKDQIIYNVLIAGERRLQGWGHVAIEEFNKCPLCQEMWDDGCELCKSKFKPKKVPKGYCYLQHFGTKPGKPREFLEVRFCVGISPVEALFLQFSENTHMAVPAHEEAQAYAQLFGLIRTVDEKFPKSLFAKLVGRSTDTISNALKYVELPAPIHARVEKKEISYGIALELTRLQTMGMEPNELDQRAKMAIAGKYRVEDFRKNVTELIKNYTSGQQSLFEIFGEEQQKQLERGRFKLIVERRVIAAIWDWIGYFSRVLNLFRDGNLGKEDSPFSYKSPVRVFRKFIDILEQNLPYMWSLLPKKERNRSREVIAETKIVLSKLEERASD